MVTFESFTSEADISAFASDTTWTGIALSLSLIHIYGEVTGVVEHNVVYPQKLVYYFADGPLTLLDTDSAYFEGKTLTTLAFDAARLQSPLIWSDDPPELALQLFRQAQARVDSLVGSRGPSASWVGAVEGGAGYAHCGIVAPYDNLISAYGAAYPPLRLATHGLGLLYGLSLIHICGVADLRAVPAPVPAPPLCGGGGCLPGGLSHRQGHLAGSQLRDPGDREGLRSPGGGAPQGGGEKGPFHRQSRAGRPDPGPGPGLSLIHI